MSDKKDSVTETILRWGARKRARMEADSKLGFWSYIAKMLLATLFILLDGIFIPSGFEALGLLTFGFVVPIAITLLVAAVAELKVLSMIR